MGEDFIKMLDAVHQLAEFNGTYYRALLEQGFDEDQALELVGIVTSTMLSNGKDGYNAKY
jgi:hypothetical protein